MDPFIILVGIVLILISNIIDRIKNKGKEEINNDEIITSAKLHSNMERELGKHIPKINDASGSGNSLARRDKSWSSLPDFIIKLIKSYRDDFKS